MRRQFWFRVLTLSVSLGWLCIARAQVEYVRLNEIFANNLSYPNPDGSVTDLLELYNSGSLPADMTGCSLTDSNANPRRYVFPNGFTIPAGGFLRIMCDSKFTNDPPSATKVPFGIKASGGFVYFFGPFDTNIWIDAQEYGLQPPDFSIGRVTDGTGPWQLTVPTLGGVNVGVPVLGPHSAVVINEWMTDGNDFVELYNTTNVPIDVSGMFLSDTVANAQKFMIPNLSFMGTGVYGAYLKFDCDGGLTTPRYPADHCNFGFNNSGNEPIGFYDTVAAGNGVVDFIFLTGNSGNGVSQGRLPDGAGGPGAGLTNGHPNRVSFPKINDYDTRSPGAPNFLILTNLSINELLTHTDPPLEDAIEILNLATTNQNISGWWLSNQRLFPKKFKIPNGPVLTNRGFRVIYEGVGWTNGFNSTNTAFAVQPFTFNAAHGDQCVLSQVDASGNLTGYILYEEFEPAANGVSFGHYNTSVPNDYKFVAMSERSFGFDDPNYVFEFRAGTGKTNPYPRVGPLVINEIMFAPSNTMYVNTNGSNVFGQNTAEEYIEVRNITSTAVPLYNVEFLQGSNYLVTNYWKLQKAISFNFPLTNFPPNSFCIVVGFDPYTNAAALDNFRTRFNVSNSVPIFGPWTGQLNDAGDAIELYRPDPIQQPPHPDAGFVPYVRIDKVNYKTALPWPGGANGTGFSLQRKNSLSFGNDPINWASDGPNPGRASIALQDTDGDGMPDLWESTNGFNPNNPNDAALDTDGDGVNNLGEYLAGTNPRDANSRLKISSIVSIPATNVIITVTNFVTYYETNVSPNVGVRFIAYSNATYSLQYRGSLTNASANWTRVGDVSPLPFNRMVEVQDTNAWKKTDRYYRVIAPAAN